mmetsp:Transcript_11601/g.24835  ORF Transcript_11601/g.24835 Transcript_11601/m.24835 type:complete len:643 (-) Transcript_11601:232-2160(-)
MRPSMELPLTGFHCFNTGTPLGPTTDFLTGCFFFLCVVLLTLLAEDDLPLPSFSSELPPTLLLRLPKNENGLALPPDSDGCVGCCFFVGAAAPVLPPKRLNVGLLFFFVAASLGFDLFALAVVLGFFFEGCILKRLIVGLLLMGAGAGAGAMVAFLLAKNGADLGLEVLFLELTCLDCSVDDDDAPPMPKMLSVGDFFLGVALVDDVALGVLLAGFFFDGGAPPMPNTDAVVFFILVSLDDDDDDAPLDGFLGVAELVPKREIVGERFTTEEEEAPFATAFGAAATLLDVGCFVVFVFSTDVEEAVLNESNKLMVGERFAGGAGLAGLAGLALGDFLTDSAIGGFLGAFPPDRKENMPPPLFPPLLVLFPARDALPSLESLDAAVDSFVCFFLAATPTTAACRFFPSANARSLSSFFATAFFSFASRASFFDSSARLCASSLASIAACLAACSWAFLAVAFSLASAASARAARAASLSCWALFPVDDAVVAVGAGAADAADASVDLEVLGMMGATGGLGVVILAVLGGAISGGVGLISAAKNGLLAVAVLDSIADDVKAVPGGSDFGEDAACTGDSVVLLVGSCKPFEPFTPFTTLPSLSFHPSTPTPVTLESKPFVARLNIPFKDRVLRTLTGVPVAYNNP